MYQEEFLEQFIKNPEENEEQNEERFEEKTVSVIDQMQTNDEQIEMEGGVAQQPRERRKKYKIFSQDIKEKCLLEVKEVLLK